MTRRLEDEHRKKWPAVDDDMMRSEKGGQLCLCDAVYYSRLTEKGRFADSSEVVVPGFDSVRRVLPIYGPVADICSKSPRLKLHGREHRIRRAPSLWASAVAHLLFIALWFFSIMGGSFLHDRLLTEATFVEVSFGVTEELQPSVASQQNAGASDLDTEATKLAQQLPQLTKAFAIETKDDDPEAVPLPTPTVVAATQTPTPTPTPKPTVAAQSTPPPDVKVLKVDEVIRRIEREQRVVGLKEKAGTHQKGGKGVKDALSALPADPFAASGRLAQNAITGSLDGRLSSQARSYQTSALAHVKRHWSLSEFEQFDSRLSCQVEISLNMFGKILSLKILKSSGNSDFDDQALAALEGANPFPDFSDENIQRRTLVLNFKPREVK